MKLIIVFTISLLFSCNSIKITDVNKKFVRPGRSNISPYIEYSAKFKVLKPLFLKDVNLNKGEENIERYSIINLNNGLIINKGKELTKGNYYFSTKVTNLAFKNSKDTLNFIFSKEGNLIDIEELVHMTETRLHK